MAPIVVNGKTLGEIHRNYNYAVKSTCDTHIEKIDYNDQDLDNLFKIDRAARDKNVAYILDILKSEDLLYCSRAIKKTTWMINDPQYSHIINPQFLFTELFPHMSTKSRNKFLLHIRVNLKDKERAKDFFITLKKINIQMALKWLPYCTEQFITENIKFYLNDLSLSVLTRIMEISLNFLYIFCLTERQSYNRISINVAMKSGMKYANRDMIKYLDILDSIPKHTLPHLSPKITKIIMNKHPQRIFNNFERYIKVVDIKTFLKTIKQTDIKTFLIERIVSGHNNYLFGPSIQHVIMRLPEHERFDFVQEHFIDKEDKRHGGFESVTRLDNIYKWYIYAPFEKAFKDLTRLIRLESNANERHAMIYVMLHCAGNNLHNIHHLLEYYKNNHINEAFKCKNHFINTFLDKTCDFDEKTWNLLQDIFMSMEVYSESDNNVQTCLRWIMLYKIIHNQVIPHIVLSKFNFSTFKKEQSKLKDCDKEKVFTYLLTFTKERLYKCEDQDLEVTLNWANNMLNLLRDWHQDLKNYPDLIKTIAMLSRKHKEKTTPAIFNNIYNKNKSWRKYLINESILLSPSEATCINALKHNPELLRPSREEIKAMCLNDKIPLNRFLRKLRIYNIHLAREFEEIYLNNFHHSSGIKSSVVGLCLIYPSQKLSPLINKYIPDDNKINWNQCDERKLRIQKLIAGNMHIARPQPPIHFIMSYARGDYLQYALASLSSVLCNISSVELQNNMNLMNTTSASLKKHIIRGAFMKFQLDELVIILSSIWEKTKNSTIRATIFRLTFNLLCKETESEKIECLWSIMNNLIDTLTVDENKIIFVTFSQINQVPLQVRPAYCMKGYAFIKKLPQRSNCNDILYKIISNTRDIMEFMDPDFMIEILMESYEEKLFKNRCQYIKIISAFLLSTQDETSQMYRYNNVLVPLLHDIQSIWELEKADLRKVNIGNLLNTLLEDIDKIVIKKNMLMPITLFRLILKKVKELPFEEHYTLITSRRLALEFIMLLDECLKNDPIIYPIQDLERTRNLYISTIRNFSKICLNNLIEDIEKYGTSIVYAYGTAVNDVFKHFHFCDGDMKLELCEAILNQSDRKEGFLLVLYLIPPQLFYFDRKKQMQILKKIWSHPDNEVKISCSVFKNDLHFL